MTPDPASLLSIGAVRREQARQRAEAQRIKAEAYDAIVTDPRSLVDSIVDDPGRVITILTDTEARLEALR